MLGHKIKFIYGGSPEENEILQPILKKLNIPYNRYKHFVPGSMFLARSNILEKLKTINLQDKEFSFDTKEIRHYGTPAHALERLFGILTEYEGYEIKDTKPVLIKFINKILQLTYINVMLH